MSGAIMSGKRNYGGSQGWRWIFAVPKKTTFPRESPLALENAVIHRNV